MHYYIVHTHNILYKHGWDTDVKGYLWLEKMYEWYM